MRGTPAMKNAQTRQCQAASDFGSTNALSSQKLRQDTDTLYVSRKVLPMTYRRSEILTSAIVGFRKWLRRHW